MTQAWLRRCLAFPATLALLAGGVLVGTQGLAQQFGPAQPGEPIITTLQVPNLPLGVVTFPNGKAMNLSVAFGSGAFRHPADAPGRLWLLTDRGPSIPCAEAKRLIGVEPDAACPGARDGRIYPLPGFVPSIYGVDIGPDFSTKVAVYLPLKGKSGKPISGRPTPMTSGPKAETVFSAEGKTLPADPSGLDPEALVRLADGSFWLGDEFGPSLAEVGPDGTVRRRLVPANAIGDFKEADYDIVPALPAILRQRKQNHGFTALAVSPDEQFLYAMLQSPLAQPDEASTTGSRAVRLFKLDRASGIIVGQYLYKLDAARRFSADGEGRERAQAEVRVTEMTAIGPDKLLVMEQIDRSSRIHLVTLEDASRIPPEFDSPETRPSLEMFDEAMLTARALPPLTKTLVLDGDKVAGLPNRIEGMAVLSPGELVLINDNDFSIDGGRTHMVRIGLPPATIRPQSETKAERPEQKTRTDEK